MKQQEFDELILKFKEKGKTIFISSHVLPEVEMLCDRVAIIKNGKIVAENTMAKLKSMAMNRFEVVFKGDISERKFGKSAGVKNISKSGEKFIFDVEGDVNKFIKNKAIGAASTHKNHTTNPPRIAPKLFPVPPTITITQITNVYLIGL